MGHVLLTPWKGEPLVVGSGSLLSVASELLLRSPLLVQEYVADTSAHTASVALPIADADDRTEAPSASLELSESLEQLRALAHDVHIQIELAPKPVPAGVDTEADLEAVRAHMASEG